MHQRPAWLKALAGVAEDAVESPAAAALGSVVLDYSRSAMHEEAVIDLQGQPALTHMFAASPDNDGAADGEEAQDENAFSHVQPFGISTDRFAASPPDNDGMVGVEKAQGECASNRVHSCG